MSKNFTPGPWTAIRLTESDRLMYVKSETNSNVAVLFPTDEDPNNSTQEANANLIAAAPDLLQSLSRLENYVTRCMTLEGKLSEIEIEIIIGHARQAIAIATL